MATNYFDEHGVDDTEDAATRPSSEESRMLLDLARHLLESGFFLENDAANLFDDAVPPPTSKAFLAGLEEVTVREEEPEGNKNCPICLKAFEQDDVYVDLPCKHRFHSDCVMPWLKKTSSCPMCRHALPTDDRDYEEMKRQKKRRTERERDIENLHNSMFG